jgi:serine/threonine-protein kinase
MTIAPGTLIGQYRVLSLLGEGGMGAVYYAEHIVLGQPAAIKVLHPHVARDSGLVQRFINEARIAAQMKHRNIVGVHDCGMFPSPDAPSAQWYIALEYLQGVSLSKLIADHGKPFDPATIVHILGEAANGLHAAHELLQLVHRDVKPDNLFLIETEDDARRVKILDFGIAKLRQPGSAIQTQSQTAMGTPAYAAPEQLRESKDVDARADVWALGVIAHEMITGVRPWGATTSVWEIIAHHTAMRTAPDPRDVRADIPVKVAKAISKAMEPDPDRRWRSARDFVRALAEAATMPFSRTGMAILDKYAPELTKGSSHSLTLGRPLPPELQASPAEILSVPAPPWMDPSSTLSDGVPRSPSPRTSPLGIAPPRTLSTISASSGQAIAAPAPRGRRRVIAGITAIGVTGLAIAVTFSLSRGSPDARREGSPRTTAVIDTGSTQFIDAARATSALAIVSDPDGANITVDGVSKGRAPVTLQLPVGAAVELRAELPGHALASQSLTVAMTPTTVRLDLPQLVDAGVAPQPVPLTVPLTGGRDGSHGDRQRPQGSTTGSGSDSKITASDVL